MTAGRWQKTGDRWQKIEIGSRNATSDLSEPEAVGAIWAYAPEEIGKK